MTTKSARKNLTMKQKSLIYEAMIKKFFLDVGRWILIVGISYIIIGPLITIISKSFMSVDDVYSPLVFIIPMDPTLENIKSALLNTEYFGTLFNTMTFVIILMILQIIVSAIVGYGFARYEFPFKNLLFGGVILTIVVPTHTIMVPLYTQFRYFDVFGIMNLVTGSSVSLIGGKWPIMIMTVFGNGLRTGLYIYIFRQFFRGLPKAIEEAALIDGAGVFRTFFKIMLPNATPSIVTVLLFSLVWQYNDTFYASLFMPNADLISLKLTTLAGYLSTIGEIYDPNHVDLIVNAGVLFSILPVILIYIFLQRYFVEGIERSGIVG